MANDKGQPISNEEIAESLVQELGLADEEDLGDAGEFFELVREREAETRKADDQPKEQVEEEEAERPTWVHEPTGREFDNELDYLRYNSGWTADRLGTENKELRERLEKLESQRNGGQQNQGGQQTPDRKQIMKQIWPDLDEETLNDPAMRTIYQGLERTAEIIQQSALQREESLKGEIAALKSQLEEQGVRSQYGVSPDIEQKILEKHPYLKSLGPKERLAVIADLHPAKKAPEQGSPKLADKIPQRKAVDHVEGSVSEGVPEGGNEALEKRLFDMDDNSRLGVFGRLFEQSNVARQLMGEEGF